MSAIIKIDEVNAKQVQLKRSDLNNEKINENDLFLIVDSFIDIKGLISHHIESANKFYSSGIEEIILRGFEIERTINNERDSNDEDNKIERIHCKIIPTKVNMNTPSILYDNTGKEMILFPNTAMEKERTYSSSLCISCDVVATAFLKNGMTIERKDTIHNHRICKVPIIKGSILCNTYNQSKEVLINMKEDPVDPGGYFIVKGGEWGLDCVENMIYNQPKIYKNVGYGNSLIRCEFISKPGDAYQNSDQIIIRYMDNNTLTVEIRRDKLAEVQIPFYMVFRALGWSNDKEMMDWIIYDHESKENAKLKSIIKDAIQAKYDKKNNYYHTEYDTFKVLKNIVNMIPEELIKYYELAKKEENYHNAVNEVLRIIDTHFLPHIGLTANSRHEKLKYLGLLIRKTILVHLDVIPQTDRDSYRNKRITAAGDNYAKTFKTFYNQTVVMPIKRKIFKDFTSAPFNTVNLANLVKSSIYANEFEKAIVQTITVGNKANIKIKKRQTVNRLSAQMLHRKNMLNVYAMMRQISSTSTEQAKQSERASQMRRVHASAQGFRCPSHSSTEGENVGVNGQMTIGTSIAPASSSEVLKNILISDQMLISDNTLLPIVIARSNLSRVYVNGYLIGYCRNALEFADKYRQMRRNLEINHYTTIMWDNVENEVRFFVDMGRLTRPLMIVYNTMRDVNILGIDEKKENTDDFQQGIAITQSDIKALYEKTKTIDDLVRERKVEFISPEEQENCLICPSLKHLINNKNNILLEYTHCDIPQAIMGITALTSPFANHNQAPRLTYQTSQVKQTGGHYAVNWPFRYDKECFLHYINEQPVVKTMTNKLIFPNGFNVTVAIMTYTGYNQEDSVIMNKGPRDRGTFAGSKFTFYKAEFEQKEELGNPDASKTDGLKSANYEKLVNGLVRRGDRIKEGDVIIGRYMINPKSKDSNFIYVDRSIVYKEAEDAIVQSVVYERNEDGNRFAKVAVRKIRDAHVGDKLSSRSGQKGILSLLMRESDMPFTESGMRPVLLFNPHGIPSRMTVAQLIESMLGNLCALKGTHVDGTMFKEVDIESIAEQLEQVGLHRYGYEKLYSGITGEPIDVDIFMGPVFYQKLAKFVLDANSSVGSALTDAITNQPLDGISSGGSLRIGEMERDVIVSHGSSKFMHEKYFRHSDGYVDYVCRCGKPAIVNHKQEIYKCKYCGDNADIVAYPSSWTSKLFIQEMESTNVGIRRMPEPYTYYINDDEKRSLTQISKYDSDAIKQLTKHAEEAMTDATAPAEDLVG